MATTLYAKAQNVAILKNEYAQIAIGVGLLACSSQISIPLQPVPITMQTVAVLLIGLFYTPRQAVKTVLAYLALGAVGLPVFACFGGGIAHFLKPSAGYLLGFLPAAALMAYYREKVSSDTFLTQITACVLGTVVLYALGISYLSLFVGVSKAFYYGLVPFIIPSVAKGFIVAYAVKHIKSSSWM